jgi:hypothetical protein
LNFLLFGSMISNLLSAEIVFLIWNIQVAALWSLLPGAAATRRRPPSPSYANGPADPLSLGISGGQSKGMTGFESLFVELVPSKLGVAQLTDT